MKQQTSGEPDGAPVLEGSALGAAPAAYSGAEPAAARGWLGAVVGGRYEILSLVGSGGMGTVFRARDSELEETVALKVLRRDLVEIPGVVERFRREVKLARRVTHRNVARVFDIGEHRGDRFLTMELVDGEPLGDRLRRGPLPWEQAIRISLAIAEGLAAAHAAGVVHRDLKPDNVLLARDGRVVITDFGIARTHFDEGDALRTQGAAVGTPAYMAPEQIESDQPIDARADIYAFGAVMFELFTGRRAWPGEAAIAVAAARLLHPPPDPLLARPDLPLPYAQLISRCLERKPADRFASAEAVAAALRAPSPWFEDRGGDSLGAYDLRTAPTLIHVAPAAVQGPSPPPSGPSSGTAISGAQPPAISGRVTLEDGIAAGATSGLPALSALSVASPAASSPAVTDRVATAAELAAARARRYPVDPFTTPPPDAARPISSSRSTPPSTSPSVPPYQPPFVPSLASRGPLSSSPPATLQSPVPELRGLVPETRGHRVGVEEARPAPTSASGAPSSAGKTAVPSSSTKTVAVLPFRNAGNPDDEYLADGLTDELIDTLSMTPGLRVRSRGVVMPHKGTDADPREIGLQLGVGLVVEGSIRRTPAGVRITARVVAVRDGSQLWAKRFDRSTVDVFVVSDEVARAVAEALTLEGAAPAREAPADPAAMDLYLRARQEYRKYWPENVKQSVELFEQALALSPDNATILSAYALACARLWWFGGGTGARAGIKARDAAERAHAGAPHLGEPHLALAQVMWNSGDAGGAAREITIALARAPTLAEAHALRGRLLVESGALEEGIKSLITGMTLEPNVPLAVGELARAYALLERWDQVPELAERAAQIEGPQALWFMRARFAVWQRDKLTAARFLAQMGDKPQRVLAVAKWLFEQVVSDAAPTEVIDLSFFVARDEASSRRRSFIFQMEAEVRMFYGQHDAALTSIERSVGEHLVDAAWMDRCPLLTPLHRHPRFLASRAIVEARVREVLAELR